MSQTISATKFNKVNHPFMWDTKDESEEIYCPGNDALINLNLSCSL